MFSGTKKVAIDKQLYRRVAKAAEQAGYASPEEMIAHILEREVAKSDEQCDRDQAEKQLRGLGYIE